MTQDSAIERVDTYSGLTMACAPSEAKKRLQELQAFVKSNMEPNVDFGIIPGTNKPSLYQPGAQKLAEIYGFGHRFLPVEQVKDWEHGFFYFEYRCVVFSRRDGRDVAEGIGSCNSRESKYGDRWVFDREVPAGLDIAKLKTREGKSKKPPYGSYKLYLVPNPDPYSLVNTIQKMAAKRAYIHAVIAATRSSGLLTQDVEDLPPDAFGRPEETRSWEHDPETGEVQDVGRPSQSAQAADDSAIAGRGLRETGTLDPRLAMLERFAFHEAALVRAKTIDELRVAWDAICDDTKRTRISLEQRGQLTDQKNLRARPSRLASS
jgi:hypothetical protein